MFVVCDLGLRLCFLLCVHVCLFVVACLCESGLCCFDFIVVLFVFLVFPCVRVFLI